MKKDSIDDLFQGLDFDVAEPVQGHNQRFREKLEQETSGKGKSSRIIPLWMPWLSIAACLSILVMLFSGNFNQSNQDHGELASVSPEMAQTQDFYSSVIRKELASLEREKTPETEVVIEDALKQLNILETDYEKLKTDLVRSGQDNRVIYAMIKNFQKRIDLLNQVLEKVNTINTIKSTPHENNIL